MNRESDFFQAVRAGDRARVSALLDEDGGLANARAENGLPAVITAMYHHEPDIADLLAERGAELDLFSAVALGRDERVTALLDANPDALNTFSGDGFQPAHLAAYFGRAAVMLLLLKRGAQVERYSQNALHVMPLHSAVAGQHLDIARLLLDHGADPNAAQGEGFTPLMGAAQNGQMEMVELLLSYGADATAKSEHGESALDMARQKGHEDVARRLQSEPDPSGF